MTRHRWSEPVRPDPNTTDRRCVVCGIVLRTRKEHPQYWNEYWHDGARLEGRPDCVGVVENEQSRAA